MSKKNQESLCIIVEENARFKGDINTIGSAKINGIFNGNIVSTKNVIIDSSAKINGNIKAETIIINGYVKGNLYGKSKVHLTSTCILEGEIITKNFKIDKGAHLVGKCKHIA